MKLIGNAVLCHPGWRSCSTPKTAAIHLLLSIENLDNLINLCGLFDYVNSIESVRR